MVDPERLQMIIWRMCIACWINTHTHSECAIFLRFHGDNYAKAPQSYMFVRIICLSTLSMASNVGSLLGRVVQDVEESGRVVTLSIRDISLEGIRKSMKTSGQFFPDRHLN